MTEILFPFSMVMLDDSPVPLIRAPHAPSLPDARVDVKLLRDEGIACIDKAAAAKIQALDIICKLRCFKQQEPRLARKRFASRKGWKAHHRAFRRAYKRAVRDAVLNANRAAELEELAIMRFAEEMHKPDRAAAITATRRVRP